MKKMRENRLRRFRYVMIREEMEAVRVIIKLNFEVKNGEEDLKRDSRIRLRMILGLLVCA